MTIRLIRLSIQKYRKSKRILTFLALQHQRTLSTMKGPLPELVILLGSLNLTAMVLCLVSSSDIPNPAAQSIVVICFGYLCLVLLYISDYCINWDYLNTLMGTSVNRTLYICVAAVEGYDKHPIPGRGKLFLFYHFLSVFTLVYLRNKGNGNRTRGPYPNTRSLVIAGPYCYVRNPMAVFSLFFYMVDRVLLGGAPMRVFIYLVLVFGVLTLWFKYFEERHLKKRFGWTYEEYCRNVPRWIPRLTRYSGPVFVKNPNEAM